MFSGVGFPPPGSYFKSFAKCSKSGGNPVPSPPRPSQASQGPSLGDQPRKQRTRKNSKSLRDFEFFLVESLIEGPSTTEPYLGSPGGNLGPFGGHLEEIWTHLGVTWAIWEVIRGIQGSLGDDSGASRVHPGSPGGSSEGPGRAMCSNNASGCSQEHFLLSPKKPQDEARNFEDGAGRAQGGRWEGHVLK